MAFPQLGERALSIIWKSKGSCHRSLRSDSPPHSNTECGIAEGMALLEKALKSHRFGSYTLQAAIAAVHAEAESVAVTDWRQIVALYNQLLRIQPSPVVQLNRAGAIAICDGPKPGLAPIAAVLEHGELANY